MTKVLKLATVAAFTLAALSAQAASEPAVIYDTAGKFDKSFNEAVFRNGVEVYNKDKGVKVKEFEPQNEAQREQGLRRLASRGNGPIVAVGFNMGSAVEKVATEFPNTQFTIIDMVVDKPNVQSLIFKEHEGSFLVGALAAIASKTGKVGFVGGMDIPLIRKFQCGYVQGAKYINPKIDVYLNMTGSTPAAFADPAKGAELAKSQFAKGADVVYAAAGGTGIGVYQAAKDEGKLATVAAFTLAALSAQAASEPAVIYDTAGKFDKSFNEAVFRNGVEVYNKDKGVKVKEFEPQNEAQREQGLRRLASRGNGPIVAVG
ncbi:MAG: BMP family ABC transporter substrate-binding protein, partial [Aeromonas sobria]